MIKRTLGLAGCTALLPLFALGADPATQSEQLQKSSVRASTLELTAPNELTEPRIRGFVTNWFRQFDLNQRVEDFLRFLPESGFYMEFPGKKITNHSEFLSWFDSVDNFTNVNHDLIRVAILLTGRTTAKVSLDVNWSATEVNGQSLNFDAHQEWQLSLSEKGNVQIVSYIVTERKEDKSEFPKVDPADVDAGTEYKLEPLPVTDRFELAGKRIAIVAAHGFEEIEVTYPLHHLKGRGASVQIVSPDWIENRVMAVNFLKPSVWLPVDLQISQARAEDYDAVIVPGGAWNPIILRTDSQVLHFIQLAQRSGAILAAICHGPQILMSAGLTSGRTLTGVTDILADLRNSGANVVEDKSVVIDGNLITSRNPTDLQAFMREVTDKLTEQKPN